MKKPRLANKSPVFLSVWKNSGALWNNMSVFVRCLVSGPGLTIFWPESGRAELVNQAFGVGWFAKTDFSQVVDFC